MLDGTACGNSKAGVRTFCCPTSDKPLPKCGWYTHNNGKCKGDCPSDTFEVGSTNIACRSGFQTACCTTGPGMDLYPKCKWQAWPDCSAGVCDLGIQSTILSHSMTGSGGSVCAKRQADDHRWGNDGDRQVRINCCDTSDPSETFEDCEWYTNIGLPPGDKNFCTTGCPAGKVRVALEQDSMRCSSNRGAAVQCCTPKAQTYETQMPELSSEDRSFAVAMDLFMDDPERFCTAGPLSLVEKNMAIMGADVGNSSLGMWL
jgi:chitinase